MPGGCPSNFFIPPSEGPWDCIEISATARNVARRDIQAIDVFGNLYDDLGDTSAAVSLDPSIKAPLTTIEGDFKRNKDVPVKFILAVQRRAPRPFKFRGLKGQYRAGQLAKTFKPFDECELDTSACEDGKAPESAMALRQGGSVRYDDKYSKQR